MGRENLVVFGEGVSNVIELRRSWPAVGVTARYSGNTNMQTTIRSAHPLKPHHPPPAPSSKPEQQP